MDPGKLDRRVTIQARTTIAGAAGGSVASWTDSATIWAQKVESTGSEGRSSGALLAGSDVVLRIRYRSDLTTKDRFYFDGRYYDILQINEEKRRVSQLVQGKYVEGRT